MITRVRVPSIWKTDTLYGEAKGIADFTLGVGPCGKTVERLDVHFHTHGVVIKQVCACNEYKMFVYPWHTVTGRVEVTHGNNYSDIGRDR